MGGGRKEEGGKRKEKKVPKNLCLKKEKSRIRRQSGVKREERGAMMIYRRHAKRQGTLPSESTHTSSLLSFSLSLFPSHALSILACKARTRALLCNRDCDGVGIPRSITTNRAFSDKQIHVLCFVRLIKLFFYIDRQRQRKRSKGTPGGKGRR